MAASTRRVRAFKRWMNSNGFECSDALEIRDYPATGALSVRALSDLTEGDVVAKIPKRACLTINTSAARDLVRAAALDGYLGLSVALMFERSLGDHSPWAPYLQLLPYHECLPLVWTPQEVDSLLRGTELQKTVKEDMPLIYEDWKENILPLLELKPFQIDPSFFRLEDYFAAKTLIASRSFEIDDYHGFGMVPLADLFNHKTAAEDVHFTSVSSHSESDDEAESGQTNDNTETDDDEDDDEPTSPPSSMNNVELDISLSGVKSPNDNNNVKHPLVWGDDPVALEMIIIKDVKSGCEVYNTYGLLGNAALLHRYGFTEPDNPFDIVNIDLELVLQWSASLFSSRYSRARISLWRRLGYAGCVSQDSEYFEISFDGEPQMELLILLYIMFLPEDSYSKLDFSVSTGENLEKLKGLGLFSSGGNSAATRYKLMTKNVSRAILSIADIREGLYGTTSLEDDTKASERCCSVKEKKLFHSLTLRISERRILEKLRTYVTNPSHSRTSKCTFGTKRLKRT